MTPYFAEPLATDLVLPKGPVTADFRASVEKALAGMIPTGKTGAVIGVVTERGLVLGLAARLNDTWTLGGDVERTWSGDVTGRVMVVGAW